MSKSRSGVTQEPSTKKKKNDLRMYQSIWEQVKTNGKCVVKAYPQTHFRLKKAVIKEKDMDITFKVENEEKKHRLKISLLPGTQDTLVFELVAPITTEDL